jgi:mannonate dehydratase
VTSFDLAAAAEAPLFRERAFSREELWANYEHFIRAVLPVAEEAGVRLALHPDDPPVEMSAAYPGSLAARPAISGRWNWRTAPPAA